MYVAYVMLLVGVLALIFSLIYRKLWVLLVSCGIIILSLIFFATHTKAWASILFIVIIALLLFLMVFFSIWRYKKGKEIYRPSDELSNTQKTNPEKDSPDRGE